MKYLFKILLFLFLPLYWSAAETKHPGVPIRTDLLLHKQGFTLGYSHRFRQALWVEYTLTAEHLLGKQFSRHNKFKADPAVKKNPVHPRDYARSGYDKGHLAPAADMTYSVQSMDNSFLMTNISPQIPGCNRGIWKRLENKVRRWAIREEKLHIITGPVFISPRQQMKRSRIPVPQAFYKVILDLTPPQKMIAFIVPNKTSKSQLSSFAVSVKEVENITGFNFFSDLDDNLGKHLKRSSNYKIWEQ